MAALLLPVEPEVNSQTAGSSRRVFGSAWVNSRPRATAASSDSVHTAGTVARTVASGSSPVAANGASRTAETCFGNVGASASATSGVVIRIDARTYSTTYWRSSVGATGL